MNAINLQPSFDQPKVDVLTAAGLVAMDGDNILAQLDGGPAGRVQRESFVIAGGSGRFYRQDAIEINFRIVIMAQPAQQVSQLVLGQVHFTAQPNIIGVPNDAYDGAGRQAFSKTAWLFPSG